MERDAWPITAMGHGQTNLAGPDSGNFWGESGPFQPNGLLLRAERLYLRCPKTDAISHTRTRPRMGDCDGSWQANDIECSAFFSRL
jgi:hypothetical protein